MPHRPASPCTKQPCPNLVGGGGVCADHGGRRSQRGTHRSKQSGYGYAWAKGPRAYVMQRDKDCRICGQPGKSNDHADHIKPRSQGGSDDPSNLQRLCARCHAKVTGMFDGGFGNPVRSGKRAVTTADLKPKAERPVFTPWPQP